MLTFGKFEKLTRGNDCNGSDVLVDGKCVGTIYREVEWIDTGSVSVSYGRHKVTGYRVEMFDDSDDGGIEQLCTKLGEARDVARAHLTKKKG